MGKTDWEIREELRKKDFHFRKLWNVYAAMDKKSREFAAMRRSHLIFTGEQQQKETCALMPKLRDEMYQMICRYRQDNPEL
jgi:septum formation topological specificity factor MinE